jgi:DNA-binding response OmpR family regulator
VIPSHSALVVGATRATGLAEDLARIGYAVESVDTPERALDAICRRRPDVVISSLLLGGMGTSSFIGAARRLAGVPVVVAAPHDAWIEAPNVGADAVVFVPHRLEALNHRIEAVIADRAN